LRQRRNGIFIVEPFRRVLRGKQARQLFVFKSDKGNIEILRLQCRKLGPGKVLVPTCVKRELIVSDDVGALLCLAEVIQNDDRNFVKPQLLGGKKTPVASNDPGLGVNQNCVVKAEFGDAGCDLGYLGVGMSPRISGPRD
jgi:hypothetical protein